MSAGLNVFGGGLGCAGACLAVVAHRDAAPMKRLGMSSSSHMDAGSASADSTRETSAVVGLHPQRFRSEMSSRGVVVYRCASRPVLD